MSVELPNAQEIATIAGFAMQLPERMEGFGEIEWATTISVAPREEWLHIVFAPRPPHPVNPALREWRLFLWRFSLAVYLPDPDEPAAVRDDPSTPAQFADELTAELARG